MRIFKSFWSHYCVWIAVMWVFMPIRGYCGIYFTLSSAISRGNALLISHDSQSASLSVAFDIFSHLRLGLTHRENIQQDKGYVREIYAPTMQPFYVYQKKETRSFANSIDLQVIFYNGRLLMPYGKIGVVKKDYYFVTTHGSSKMTSSLSADPQPSAELGVGIRLSRSFSLQLAYSMSPSKKQKTPVAPVEDVWDFYSSIGVTYNI